MTILDGGLFQELRTNPLKHLKRPMAIAQEIPLLATVEFHQIVHTDPFLNQLMIENSHSVQ